MSSSPLDDMLCFALYSASHRMGQIYREILAPWELTYTQYIAIVALGDGEITVGELCRRMGLDSGTLSPLLKRLEVRGLVERRRAASDERVVTAALTASGRALAAELSAVPACLAERVGIDADAATDLLERLTALTAPASPDTRATAGHRV